MVARLERIQRKFLLGSSEECFKYPLMAWENVCLPRVGWIGDLEVGVFNKFY